MKILREIIILAVVLILSYFLAIWFGEFYVYFFPQPSGRSSLLSFYISKAAENSFIGSPLVYTFFLTLLFTAFGGEKKYWWIGILLIPAAAFEVYFDISHIYFPILLGLLGWLLGLLVSKIISTSK